MCALLAAHATADETASASAPDAYSSYLDFNKDVTIYVGFGWNKGSHDDYAGNLVTIQGDYAYYMSRRHAITLSLGFYSAYHDNNTHRLTDSGYRAFSDNYRRYSFVLMPGYRFSQDVGSRVRLNLGAMAGPDIQGLNVDFGRDWSRDHRDDRHDHWYDDDDDDCHHRKKNHGATHYDLGLAYAFYASVDTRISDRCSLTLGYAYRGSGAHPVAEPGKASPTPRRHTSGMRWHEARAGVTILF